MPDQDSSSQSPPDDLGPGPTGQGNYLVRQGECMNSIAFSNGFFWQTLWNLSQNSDLKTARTDPNALLTGDRVYIPPITVNKLSKASQSRYQFKLKGIPTTFKMQFLKDGQPRSGVPATLIVDNVTYSLTTDGSGGITQRISPEARTAKVILDPGAAQQQKIVALRGLDPYNVPCGIQQRLANLGYSPGPVKDTITSKLRDALMAFQTDNGLTANGVASQATLDKLKSVHGG